MADLTALLKRYGIGLTGGIGTGKTAAAHVLKGAGLPVIDADELARIVTAPGSPGLQAVTRAFGDGIVDGGGKLDRRALGRLVFGAPAERRRLEELLHPLIRAALGDRLAHLSLTAAPGFFVYEAALIFERDAGADFRAVWATWCPRDLQLARVMQRDAISRERAEAIVSSQMDARRKADLADAVIDTSIPGWEGALLRLLAALVG